MLALQACHESGCIAAVQAYSDKTHVNSEGLMMWPIRRALMNADLKVSPQFCRGQHGCLPKIPKNVELPECKHATSRSHIQ